MFSILTLAKIGLSQEALLSLPYGDKDQQINLSIPDPENVEGEEASGVFWFSIDSTQGNAYIAEVNVIKKFRLNGEFVLKTAVFSDIPIISFVVDKEGPIYVIHGGKASKLCKLNVEGSVSWSKALSGIVSDSNYEMMGPNINIDEAGNVICEVTYRKGPEEYEKRYLKIDKDGNFIGVVPCYHLDKNDNYYVFNPTFSYGKLYGTELFGKDFEGHYESGSKVEILNQAQQTIGNLEVTLPETFKQYENYRGINQWDIDSDGNLYATAYVRRDSDKQTILNGKDFYIGEDKLVCKFDQSEKLVSQIMFPGYPIYMNRQIQVDEKGNVYYLQFYSDHLDIVKLSNDAISPTSLVSVSPYPNSDGWNKNDVTINITATDNEGGSGVKEIHYKLTGAVNDEKTFSGAQASVLISTEGISSLSFYSVDNAGNVETAKTWDIKLDKTAPLLTLKLDPYKLKLPFRHEKHHFYTPFFYKLTYSSTDTLSGIKGSKTGLITPNINSFKTQLINGKQLHIIINVNKKHMIIIATNPQQVLDQLKNNLLIIDNNQVMHLNQRPKAKGWMINKIDKFLVISAPSILFKAEAGDNADNLTAKELKYEKKKIPMPEHCKPMINRKEFSQEEIEDLMEDMNIDTDTMKNIRKNYKVK